MIHNTSFSLPHLDFGSYSYSRVGFPGVKLKWQYDKSIGHYGPYLTINGVMHPWMWQYSDTAVATVGGGETGRFDAYVVANFSDDASVQG
jgi:hypothetical protein